MGGGLQTHALELEGLERLRGWLAYSCLSTNLILPKERKTGSGKTSCDMLSRVRLDLGKNALLTACEEQHDRHTSPWPCGRSDSNGAMKARLNLKWFAQRLTATQYGILRTVIRNASILREPGVNRLSGLHRSSAYPDELKFYQNVNMEALI